MNWFRKSVAEVEPTETDADRLEAAKQEARQPRPHTEQLVKTRRTGAVLSGMRQAEPATSKLRKAMPLNRPRTAPFEKLVRDSMLLADGLRCSKIRA